METLIEGLPAAGEGAVTVLSPATKGGDRRTKDVISGRTGPSSLGSFSSVSLIATPTAGAPFLGRSHLAA